MSVLQPMILPTFDGRRDADCPRKFSVKVLQFEHRTCSTSRVNVDLTANTALCSSGDVAAALCLDGSADSEVGLAHDLMGKQT